MRISKLEKIEHDKEKDKFPLPTLAEKVTLGQMQLPPTPKSAFL